MLSLCGVNSAWAEAYSGQQIAEEIERRDQGWGDSQAEMTMILQRRNGKESTRRMRSMALEMSDVGDRGLIIFDEPRDVKGTVFLNHSNSQKADDQWLYLPALRRTKRISSGKKSGRFMGSEFSYEDMSALQIEKYEFSLLAEKEWQGMAVFELEALPVDVASAYSKQRMLVDKSDYRIHQIAFYDRRGEHFKTMNLSEFALYKGKYWRARKAVMQNLKSGRKTTLRWDNLRFDTGLLAQSFHYSKLQSVQ